MTRGRLLAAILAMAGLPLLTWAQAQGKPHPRLVTVAMTRCTTCHQSLLQGKPHVHPATEDCANCHSMDVQPGATRVSFTAEGTALCLTCHDGLGAAAEGKLKAPHAPVADSCTNCHDPHASMTPRLLKAALPELCATCHELDALQLSHKGQLTAKANCASCHVPHGSGSAHMLKGATQHAPFADRGCDACHRAPTAGRVRLQARSDRLCTACHADLAGAAPATGSRHAALQSPREGNACLSCHNPHMSANPKLLVKTGPALCTNCHPAVVAAAAAKNGHPPAADDCLTCHKPHVSDKPKLLTDTPRALCQGCHHPEGLKKAHLGADPASLACASCHTPHGTGNAKLLARTLHPPLLDGCDTCHQGRFDTLIENGGSALCLGCHGDVGETAAKAKVKHPALEVARCTDCHNPHASAQERLVKAPGGGPCFDCHDDKKPAAGEFEHGAISLLGCRACHEPHGSDNPKLLRASGNALCLGCHDAQKLKPKDGAATVRLAGRFEVPVAAAKAIRAVLLAPDGKRGHPTPEHLVASVPAKDPHARRVSLSFTGELGCLACHDPHKGRSPKLLAGGVASASEACLRCHPK